MSKKNMMAIALLIFIFYYAAAILQNYFGGSWSFLSDIAYLSAPLLAVVSSFWLLKVFGVRNRQGGVALFLFLGMVSFLIAEILWVVYKFIFNVDPSPSLADFFFLLAYPLIFIGLLKKILSESPVLSFKKSGLIIALGIIFVGLFSYFSIYSSYDPQGNFWQNIFLMSNGIGDMILLLTLLFILVIVFEYEKGKMAYPWLLLAFSFFSMLAADLFYAIYVVQYDEVLFLKAAIDTMWIFSYVLFSFSMFRMVSIVREKQEEISQKMNEKTAIL